ncbi:PREDICTED: uncharacterized protein LOC108500637 [Lepidothrix coronata]|uniref:Uncharacterized protein LOC108500637 n=1 Tax=Lepidothrix coronata TaxID=321398 RepID=A0A6J0HTF5_9PASS|nr:PREDICTED: uncharacterized protein LOC108500637 [Lepidothrix coronata]
MHLQVHLRPRIPPPPPRGDGGAIREGRGRGGTAAGRARASERCGCGQSPEPSEPRETEPSECSQPSECPHPSECPPPSECPQPSEPRALRASAERDRQAPPPTSRGINVPRRDDALPFPSWGIKVPVREKTRRGRDILHLPQKNKGTHGLGPGRVAARADVCRGIRARRNWTAATSGRSGKKGKSLFNVNKEPKIPQQFLKISSLLQRLL